MATSPEYHSCQSSPSQEKENLRITEDDKIKNNEEPYKVIGKGTFGEVILFVHPMTGEKLARKKIRKLFGCISSAQSIYREVALQSSCRHDNIVKIIGIDIPSSSSAGKFREMYLDMELMRFDLYKRIHIHDLDLDCAKVFLYQLLRGLKYLHSANIIHGDIKPDNILISENGVLKIADFGHSLVCESLIQGIGPHKCVRIGTICYKAPELLMGIKQYTRGIDMWAVGCTFIEMIAKEQLFRYESPTKELDVIIYTIGTPTERELDGVGWKISDPIRALKKRQGGRPNTKNILLEFAPKLNEEALDLLMQMLSYATWRITADEALNHPFLEYGRSVFHSYLCTCCSRSSPTRHPDPEPKHTSPFDLKWENDLANKTIVELREKVYNYTVNYKKANAGSQ